MKYEILQKVGECFSIASQRFNRAFVMPEVDFSLRGTTAGQAIPMAWKLRFNLDLAYANRDHFLTHTVPHEVAHLVANSVYGKNCGHGWEWKHIMTAVFKIPAIRCHSYDVSHCRARRTSRFIYRCGCGTVRIGPKHHKMIQQRAANGCASRISCRTCRKSICADDFVQQVAL